MKNTLTARPRTLALLMAATVLPATPVFAQETVVPPPVTATTPQPEAPAAPPVAATPAPAPVFAPRAEIVQPLPVRPVPAPAAEVADPASRATVTRNAPRPRAVAAAPAAAPAAVTPAPVATPEVAPKPAAPVASTAPEVLPTTSDATDATQTSTTTMTTSQLPWMWIVGGLIALGAIVALLFTRRRRPVDETVYEEPAYVAPTGSAAPVVDPLLTAPVYTPPVAPKAVTPVADDERPWIGLSLQATGSNERGEEDLVEYNLIVENAGEVMANDVRISTFMIDGTKSSDAETALIDAVGETQSRFIDLAPGTSVPIASSLSVPHGVDPCIIAEAHYPLPGGGEGHIAARFVIENGKGDMVEARLDDVLERV